MTGGAGYIGSHTVKLLLEQGYDVAVVDDLSKGHKHNVPAGRLFQMNLLETAALTELIRQDRPEAVIHFAAFIAVGESMKDPGKYFENNVCGSLSLLRAMTANGVKHIVFSSTAAVYGNPAGSPILETFPIQPVNAYGESKVMVEKLLRWWDTIHGLTSACACGTSMRRGRTRRGGWARSTSPETHLIPLMLRAVQTGKPLTIFGDDYATPDGTCVRDYIHVNDLAQAHILAVEYLLGGGASEQFNVGTGSGHSVLEMVKAVEKVTGQKVPYTIGPRREGDPAELVASSEKLRGRLGWTPRFAELETIVEHAWRFARRERMAG